jgi:predicted ATPase
VLTEQLALEPSPELRRLQESILAHDPAIAPVPHAPRRRGNVPTPSTSFVDREQALAQIVELLRQHRLVTLTGPPGVGKSRLALEVVRSVESEVRDGAWLIELARTGAGMDVVRLLAQIVDARGPDPLAGVLTRLRDVETILVLDACEHVIEDAAAVASAVLAGCPGVRVLATSREVLHLVGEVRLAVEPLELPAQESSDGADSPAVQLFAARASAARPGFQLTADAVPLVAEISRQVDGLPLAIELTAARVNVLGLAELLHLVEGRLAAGRDRPPSDLARAALGTLVEWSYDLLHGDERTLLHQLAVHRGGASLASLVAGAAHDGLDETTVTYLLGALVDKSVVSVSFPAAEARYDLLDTVRDYVLERLADAGRLGVARKAHAEYFATLADAARTGLRGPEWRTWVERLELEHDNLWAALDYAREAADSGITVRLGASLGWYFTLAERVSEGRRFVELALAALPDDRPAGDRLELVAFACYLATEELDFDAAIDVAERELARPAPDAKPAQSALVEAALALAVAGRGEAERAAALSQSAFTSTERTGNDWTIAAASLLRAQVAARAGDIPTVAAMAAEAHSRTDASGFDAFRVPALLLEAWVAKRRNEPERATDAYRRALALADRTGFSDHAAFALAGLGSIAFASGDLRHAEELERQALATAESARAPWAAAHARVELARVLRASGDDDTAERLYRNVLEWSEAPRPHQPRESLFIALERDPTAGAREGLAALAAARAEAPAAPAVT